LRGQSLKDLGYAAQLHDIGKVGVPDAVLKKPSPLSAEERQLIREHAVWGAELIGRIPGLERVAEIVRHHHERYDGGGYPDGLSDETIPLESRILAVADALLAMVEERPYRSALPRPEAEAELTSARGAQFDPEVVDALREEAQAALA
jgi:HD-GYP domain-containing protein (c-di-GMP phosphodiesterase class II)